MAAVAGRSATRHPARSATPLAAHVLHRWDWSETSLIVELFTREQGRVVVVAKGAKRPTSQLRPVLLPFQPLWALLGKAPADDTAEIHTLRSAEWAGGGPLLPPAALLSAYYLNELLMKLLARQDPHPLLYEAYVDALAALAQSVGQGGAGVDAGSPAAESAALRAFELLLLREIGLLPDLASLSTGHGLPQAQRLYALHPEAGLVQLAGPARAPAEGLSGAAWLALQAALQLGQPAALRAACLPVLQPLRAQLRQVLHYHLGHTLLRTRQVGRDLQRLADAGGPRFTSSLDESTRRP